MAVGSCTSCGITDLETGEMSLARYDFANALARLQNVSATANDTPLPPVTRSEPTAAPLLERPLQIG